LQPCCRCTQDQRYPPRFCTPAQTFAAVVSSGSSALPEHRCTFVSSTREPCQGARRTARQATHRSADRSVTGEPSQGQSAQPHAQPTTDRRSQSQPRQGTRSRTLTATYGQAAGSVAGQPDQGQTCAAWQAPNCTAVSSGSSQLGEGQGTGAGTATLGQPEGSSTRQPQQGA
jgi:hypothetical protein